MFSLGKPSNFKSRKYGPVRQVILFCNARDEKHLREWVAHHLLLGFDKIIIFDHKSTLPINSILKNFSPSSVEVIRTKLDTAIKIPLMNQAANMAKKLNMDWMIYLDADEYLVLHHTMSNIKQFIDRYRHAHSIGVNWLMYGSNNLKKDPDDLILSSYTSSEILLNKHVKSFVRPFEITKADNPHFYHIKNKSRYFGVNNIQLTKTPFFNNIRMPFYKAPCYIAHFHTQSEETFNLRRVVLPNDDGTPNNNNITLKNIHLLYNKIENKYASIRYAKKIKTYLGKHGYKF
jgi:hypothetical protein